MRRSCSTRWRVRRRAGATILRRSAAQRRWARACCRWSSPSSNEDRRRDGGRWLREEEVVRDGGLAAVALCVVSRIEVRGRLGELTEVQVTDVVLGEHGHERLEALEQHGIEHAGAAGLGDD